MKKHVEPERTSSGLQVAAKGVVTITLAGNEIELTADEAYALAVDLAAAAWPFRTGRPTRLVETSEAEGPL